MFSIYKNKKIVVTGHTGFKGTWLSLWLNYLGASVLGISLKKKQNKIAIKNNKHIKTVYLDIRNSKKIEKIITKFNPDFIFHLAAQSIVKYGYMSPKNTYETNVIGTLNIFEAGRKCSNLKGIINVTSDKCYENKDNKIQFKENDKLGGEDIYSSSKASSEILTNSYRESFLNLKDYKKSHNILLASVRCGNVIGGGDSSDYRIIPDIIKSIIKNKKLIIRNSNSIRPWVYILDCLRGYLALGEKLLQRKKTFAKAYNFGPNLKTKNVKVLDIVILIEKRWKKIKKKFIKLKNFKEKKNLLLNTKLAKKELNWEPILSFEDSIDETVKWYKENEKKKIDSLPFLLRYIKKINVKN